MKSYSPQELILEKRKQRERNEAKAGEVIQSIFFAFMNGREKLKAAKTLFDSDQPNEAINTLTLALEEFGKVKGLSKLISSWKDLDRFQKYKDVEANHPIKLESFLSLFCKLAPEGNLSINLKGAIAKAAKDEDPLAIIIKFTDARAAERYHKTRMALLYSKFDGKIASSPYHYHKHIDKESCIFLTDLILKVSDKLFELSQKLLPIYIDLLTELYFETDQNRIANLKREINRRVRRTLPAFRHYGNSLLLEKYGVSIDQWTTHPEKNKMTDIFSKSSIELHLKEICTLVKGHKKIDEVFFYPPLKDEAKDFYQSMSF
jgi:AbiV family abortive infection protein